VLGKIESGVNGIIDLLNKAASVLPFTIPGFPLSHIGIPELPELQLGGIVMDDIVAKLHAGEVVLPLDRLESVLRSMNMMPTQPPIFAPVMNFYPGASPQQIVPAVDYAFSLYEERLRSGE